MLVGLDVHSLDDEQIVVERYHGVDQRDEYHDVGQRSGGGGQVGALDSCHEDEELGEHTSEGRNTTQGEQGEGHEEGQTRIGLIESVVAFHIYHAVVVLLDRRDDGEHSHIGYHVDEHVEAEGVCLLYTSPSPCNLPER